MKQDISTADMIKALQLLAETNNVVKQLTAVVQEQNQVIADLKKDVDILKKKGVRYGSNYNGNQ